MGYLNLCNVLGVANMVLKSPSSYTLPYTTQGVTINSITPMPNYPVFGTVNLSFMLKGNNLNATFDYRLYNGVYFFRVIAADSDDTLNMIANFLSLSNTWNHLMVFNADNITGTITIVANYKNYGMSYMVIGFVNDQLGSWYTTGCPAQTVTVKANPLGVSSQTITGSNGVASIQVNAADVWLNYLRKIRSL